MKIMEQIKVTYRGFEVPIEHVGVATHESFKYWASGVDAVLDGSQAVPVDPEPEYRFYHDDDDEGRRYYRKIRAGAAETTFDMLRDYGEERGLWFKTSYTIPRSDLEAYWVEIPEDEVPVG